MCSRVKHLGDANDAVVAFDLTGQIANEALQGQTVARVQEHRHQLDLVAVEVERWLQVIRLKITGINSKRIRPRAQVEADWPLKVIPLDGNVAIVSDPRFDQVQLSDLFVLEQHLDSTLGGTVDVDQLGDLNFVAQALARAGGDKARWSPRWPMQRERSPEPSKLDYRECLPRQRSPSGSLFSGPAHGDSLRASRLHWS